MSSAKQLITENQFLMLSKSWCPDCHYAQAVLKKYGVLDQVKVIELDKMTDDRAAAELEAEFTEISGRKWVPTLFFNGKKFGDEATLKQLEKEGTSAAAFKQAGLLR